MFDCNSQDFTKLDLPPSRPLTPTEQMDIMAAIENEQTKEYQDPTKRDMEVKAYDTTKIDISMMKFDVLVIKCDQSIQSSSQQI